MEFTKHAFQYYFHFLLPSCYQGNLKTLLFPCCWSMLHQCPTFSPASSHSALGASGYSSESVILSAWLLIFPNSWMMQEDHEKNHDPVKPSKVTNIHKPSHYIIHPHAKRTSRSWYGITTTTQLPPGANGAILQNGSKGSSGVIQCLSTTSDRGKLVAVSRKIQINVGSRLVWWFWLIKSLGKIIQNPAIDLMVLINKKFVPGDPQISHTNSLSCSCHAPTTTTTTTTTPPPPPPLHHQQLPSWKANLFLKKNDHRIAQGLVEKPCPFLKTCPQSIFQTG